MGQWFSLSDSECVYVCESVCLCVCVPSWLPTARKPGPSELEREQGGYSEELRVPDRKHVNF